MFLKPSLADSARQREMSFRGLPPNLAALGRATVIIASVTSAASRYLLIGFPPRSLGRGRATASQQRSTPIEVTDGCKVAVDHTPHPEPRIRGGEKRCQREIREIRRASGQEGPSILHRARFREHPGRVGLVRTELSRGQVRERPREPGGRSPTSDWTLRQPPPVIALTG